MTGTCLHYDLLVLTLSTPTPNGTARRAVLRSSWAHFEPGCSVLFRFVLGLQRFRNDSDLEMSNAMAPPARDLEMAAEAILRREGTDELVLPCQESYRELSRKVRGTRAPAPRVNPEGAARLCMPDRPLAHALSLA